MPDSLRGINRIVLGPRGLLDLLELRLGLAPVAIDHTSRLLSYREALRTAAELKKRFYSASFEVDPFGSSKVLLRWRDDLCLSGWAPELSHDSASARLQDLADVEEIFRKSREAELDESRRLLRIKAAFHAEADPGFETFDVLETVEHFPVRWRDVLERLNPTENAFPAPSQPLAEAGTRLHAMQERLLRKDGLFEGTDHTIRIVEGPVLSKNADAAAALLSALDSGQKCLISDPAELAPLNRAVQSLDSPAVGSGSRSSLGALIQLAPVLLRLHWGPFNPQAWLEFFLHPVRPLHPKLAGNLAFALNQSPSRANPAWQNAITKTLNSTEDPAQTKRINEQIASWLSPEEFSDVAQTDVLSDTMLKLSDWLSARGSGEGEREKSGWLAASSSVRSLAKSIASVPTVTREDLERIVAEWLPGAAIGDTSPPELGGPQRIATPGHLLESTDHVVWWQPREKTVSKMPWTTTETAWLEENGVAFPNHDLLTKTAQSRSYRSILNARRSLTIFHCPQNDATDGVLSPLAVRLMAEFGGDIVVASEELIDFAEADIIPLPRPRESWSISCPELLTSRENESFSSLNKFIYTPWEWVLSYKARLRSGPQVDCRISDDARRQGSLLHGFVESLLEPEPDPLEVSDSNVPDAGKSNEAESVTAGLLETLVTRLFDDNSSISWKDISQKAVTDWVENQWENILIHQAAHYLVPGNEASRSELLYLAKNAIWELLQQLRAANVVSVTCEEKITDIPFVGGHIGGFIDLKVVNEEGETGLIDMKLGGLSYRRDELVNGRHLQLAVYGQLIKSKYGKDAHCAYFIFSGGGKMLARSNRFFPNADMVYPKDGTPEEEWRACWAQFEQFWSARRGQLNTGTIELETSFDLANWTVAEPGKYSDFLHLTGWKETD